MDCRMPRTATRRGAVRYLKLLYSVDEQAVDGFGFAGRFLAPGQLIDVHELTAGRLGPPIMLECTEAEGSRGARQKRRWEALYILWRYEAGGAWIEIARAQSLSSDWALQLRDIARIALGRSSWAVVPRVAEVAARIRGLLDLELGPLDAAQRGAVLADLHDQFAARIVAAADVA
jgi:hypothetical protein